MRLDNAFVLIEGHPAKKLGRDPKSVRRDVAKLEQYGVVRTREEINPGHGRVKIVEPVADLFELRASF
jgi:predicted transcriptional regulator